MNRMCQVMTSLARTALFGAFLIVAQEVGVEQNRSLAADDDSLDAFLSNAFRTAADRASPGLVTVYTLRGPRMTAMWRRLKEANNIRSAALLAREPHDQQGSGIVIGRQGLILTCNHVVESADALFVVLADGRKFEPVDIRADPATDLAVIRIEGAGELQEVQLGNSDSVQPGDWVVSLGNPYELKQSISAGIVSATNRWVPGTPHPLIQNDAATNPGSSGGALLNLRGEVVGVISGGFGAGKEFRGIGMAIPVNTAKQVVKQLGKSGQIRHGYMGCQTQMLSPVIAKQLGLPVAGGLYVKDVEQDSPAASSGIEEGDVITHFAGQPIDDTFRPEQLYEELTPGDKYTFTLFRDGRSVAVDVQIGHPPDRNGVENEQTEIQSNCSSEHFDEQLGVYLDELAPDIARQLEFPKKMQGVLVTDVVKGSIAYKEGIAAGMVVLRFNSHAIRDLDDYRHATSTCPPNQPVLMLVRSSEDKHLLVVER